MNGANKKEVFRTMRVVLQAIKSTVFSTPIVCQAEIGFGPNKEPTKSEVEVMAFFDKRLTGIAKLCDEGLELTPPTLKKQTEFYQPKNVRGFQIPIDKASTIVTPYGEVVAQKGDWVVENAIGQREVYRDADFRNLFQPVGEQK